MALRRVLLLLLAAGTVAVRGAEQCPYPVNTLTTACDDACNRNEPCLAFPAAGCQSTSDKYGRCETTTEQPACEFECFGATANAQTYANTSMALVLSPNAALHTFLPTKTHVSDMTIGTLDVSPSATEFYMVGGTKYFYAYYSDYSPRITIQLTKGCLVKHSYLTSIVLSNFNITSPIDNLSDFFPLSLKELDLSNNHLRSLPTDLHLFRSLESLYVMYGNLGVVPRTMGNKNVKHVNLFLSNVTKFEAEFPNVENLMLGSNDLSVIPPVIFTFKQLRKLTINHHSKPYVVSQSQFKFLRGLNELELTGNIPPASQCDGSLAKLQNVTFCVVDTVANSAVVKNTNSNSKWVLIGCGAALGLGACISVFVWQWRRNRELPHKNVMNQTSSEASDSSYRPMPQTIGGQSGVRMLWSDEELLSHKISADSIRPIRELGSGATCDVWLVQHVNGLLMAAKRPKREVLRRNTALLKFLTEVKLNAILVHPRVIRLAGISWTSVQDLQALFEYAPNGDLFEWLQRPTTDRSWSQPKVRIASDIAEALVYVHSFAPLLVHRDLKSRNVLLDPHFRAKLCDFGCARNQSDNATMTAGVGTIRWLAPEVITGRSDYDGKADIYSLGVLLSELATHQLPYSDLADDHGLALCDAAILHKVSNGELRPDFGSACAQDVVVFAQRCLALDPRDRPNAMEAFHFLRARER